jgi:hypothetical protein
MLGIQFHQIIVPKITLTKRARTSHMTHAYKESFGHLTFCRSFTREHWITLPSQKAPPLRVAVKVRVAHTPGPPGVQKQCKKMLAKKGQNHKHSEKKIVTIINIFILFYNFSDERKIPGAYL